jgi:hypothetical protein
MTKAQNSRGMEIGSRIAPNGGKGPRVVVCYTLHGEKIAAPASTGPSSVAGRIEPDEKALSFGFVGEVAVSDGVFGTFDIPNLNLFRISIFEFRI